MATKLKERRRIPVSHKVIEKRRRDRINRCLLELGKAVPMALAKQSSGKLEKAEILEMTVQYLRALHSAECPRGRDKELWSEFSNYFHYGYHECMKNLVHYLTTVERLEAQDTQYARILAFLQSRARLSGEPPEPEPACPRLPLCELPAPEAAFQPGVAAHYPWHSPAAPAYHSMPLPCGPAQQHGGFLSPGQYQGLDRHYLNLMGHSHPSSFSLHSSQHPAVL